MEKREKEEVVKEMKVRFYERLGKLCIARSRD